MTRLNDLILFSKEREGAVKKMKVEIERKKRDGKERLARSRSQQQGIHICSGICD